MTEVGFESPLRNVQDVP